MPSTSTALLFAGEKFRVSLQDKLREIHEEDRASKLAEIARRVAGGVPLDGLRDPGEFVPNPAHDGVTVCGKMISARRLSRLNIAHGAALRALLRDLSSEDLEKVGALADALADTRQDLIGEVIDTVEGLENGTITINGDERVRDALERSGLVVELHQVAVAMQNLGAKKA